MIENSLAIFDLDGTLVDSVLQIGLTLNESRESLGYLPLPMSYYRDYVGLPLDILISDLEISSEAKSELIHLFRRNLVADIHSGNNVLFDGVTDVLEFFTKRGIQLAIATSKPTEIAVEVYRNSDLNRFQISVQGTDNFPAKPSPDVILRVLEKFPNHKAVMIGDRSEDIIAAKGAHIPGVGIAASAHSQEKLIGDGAIKSFVNIVDFHQYLSTNDKLFSQIFA